MTIIWNNKPLEDLSEEELLDCIRELVGYLQDDQAVMEKMKHGMTHGMLRIGRDISKIGGN